MTNEEKKDDDKKRSEYQIDIADHPNVMLWIKNVAKKDPEGFLKLIGDNVDTFKKLWGKEAWTNDGSKGWTHGWAIYENSMHWLVLTGPSGTIFRLRLSTKGEEYLSDPKVGAGIVRYLNALLLRVADL